MRINDINLFFFKCPTWPIIVPTTKHTSFWCSRIRLIILATKGMQSLVLGPIFATILAPPPMICKFPLSLFFYLFKSLRHHRLKTVTRLHSLEIGLCWLHSKLPDIQDMIVPLCSINRGVLFIKMRVLISSGTGKSRERMESWWKGLLELAARWWRNIKPKDLSGSTYTIRALGRSLIRREIASTSFPWGKVNFCVQLSTISTKAGTDRNS